MGCDCYRNGGTGHVLGCMFDTKQWRNDTLSKGDEPLADWERELLHGKEVVNELETRFKVTTTMGRVVGTFSKEEWSGGAFKAFESLNRLSGYQFHATRVKKLQRTVTTFEDVEEEVSYL